MHLVPMILVLSLLFLGDCKRVEKKTDKSKDERTKFIPRDNSDCEGNASIANYSLQIYEFKGFSILMQFAES